MNPPGRLPAPTSQNPGRKLPTLWPGLGDGRVRRECGRAWSERVFLTEFLTGSKTGPTCADDRPGMQDARTLRPVPSDDENSLVAAPFAMPVAAPVVEIVIPVFD